MTDRAPDTAANAVRFERAITVDSTFAARITAAAIRYLLLRPSRVIRVVMGSLLVAVGVSLASNSGGLSTVGLFIAAFLVLPMLYSVVLLVASFPARKQIRGRMPVGSQYSITMTDDSMRLQDSLVSSEVSYRMYKSVHSTKNVVAIYPKTGRVPTVLPRELFTPESLLWLTERVSSGQ